MTRMYNPPHPGEVLREYLGDVSVTEAAMEIWRQPGNAFTRGDGVVRRFC